MQEHDAAENGADAARCVRSADEIAVTASTLFRLTGHSNRSNPPRRQRKDRLHPTWGRSEATHSGSDLLAPLPRECKCGLGGTHNGAYVRY
jgi:hypothetical protein